MIKDKEEHKHWWVEGRDQTAQVCNCGSLKVSQSELDYRIKAWESYFDLVKTSPSFLDYQEMKEAWKAKDKPKMAEITKRIKARTHQVKNEWGGESIELNNPLAKPDFPDPSTWTKYETNDKLL